MNRKQRKYKSYTYRNKFRSSGRDWNSPQYKEWRQSVYKRDNYQCQYPGCHSRRSLTAHHIRKWSDVPTLRYNVDNGITLCWRHHRHIKSNEEYYVSIFMEIVRRNKKNEQG